jgi:hypothetical protein
MKRIILVVFVLLTQLNYSQTTINLGDFDKIKVFDQLNVTLIPSTENKIEVTGTNQANVEIVNRNSLLKIRISLTKILEDNKDLKVNLYFKNIQSIDANEGSMVSCKTVFKQTTMELSVQEGAMIEAELDVDNATAKLNSGGIINLFGKAVTQKTTITSGGILNAKNLETSQTNVSITAGGSADVNASTFVEAKVNAGGTITIFGKPKQIKQQAFAGGTIIEK